MDMMPLRSIRPLATITCSLLACLGAGETAAAQAPETAGATGQTGGCATAGASVDTVELPGLHASFLCLVNAERAASALPAVVPDASLERSAGRQSHDMVVRGFFSHASPGRGLSIRVKRAGYLRRARLWNIGETLAYGLDDVTSHELFTMLMASPTHRAIIRDARYRRVGVGLERGVPEGTGAGLTVTLHFGVISARR